MGSLVIHSARDESVFLVEGDHDLRDYLYPDDGAQRELQQQRHARLSHRHSAQRFQVLLELRKMVVVVDSGWLICSPALSRLAGPT